MASVNKVILVGTTGKDPEVRYLDGGSVVASFSLATSEKYTNKVGEKVEQTEWHNLELWGKQAEIAEKYVKKGQQLFVEGQIKAEEYVNKDGEKRRTTKIRVSSFQMLGGKKDGEASQTSVPQATPSEEDNLPF